MLQKAPTDMFPTDIAVNLKDVTKTFTQWQRDNTGKGILKNLIKPEKRIIKALDQVSFSIGKGEFVAYAGPNGAGKSTTMKLLCGMLLPNEGRITVLDRSPLKDRIPLMQNLGILFGNRTELWWDHPVIQSFKWKKVVWNIPDEVYQRNLSRVIELLDLEGILKTFARELSLGQRMRADLGLLLLHSPQLLLLDEPTLGLDVVAKRQMIEFLKRLNREDGVTIVVTSHDMDDLEEMAQRILMISNGHVAYDGSFQGLRNVTGNLTRVNLTMGGGTMPKLPQITHCHLLSSSHEVYEYEIDLDKTPIEALMGQLSQLKGLKDIEIKKAPIEQVIAQLYREWKNSECV